MSIGKFLVRLLIGFVIAGAVGGIMFFVYSVDMADLHDRVVLINPSAEIMNGRVETTETTIIHYYKEGDESKQVVFVTCNGERLKFSPDQTEVILRYLSYQKTGCP